MVTRPLVAAAGSCHLVAESCLVTSLNGCLEHYSIHATVCDHPAVCMNETIQVGAPPGDLCRNQDSPKGLEFSISITDFIL